MGFCRYFDAKAIRHTWHYTRCYSGGGRMQLEQLFDPNGTEADLMKGKVNVQTPAILANFWGQRGQEVPGKKKRLQPYNVIQLAAGPSKCANLLQSMLGNSRNGMKVLLVGHVCTESECLVLLQLMERSCFGAPLFRDTHL